MEKMLIASSATQEGITELISKFYGGATITLHEKDKTTFSVSNLKGEIEGVFVKKEKKRFKFYMI